MRLAVISAVLFVSALVSVPAYATPGSCIKSLGSPYSQHGSYSGLYWTDWSALGNGRDCAPTFVDPGDPDHLPYQSMSPSDNYELDLAPYTDGDGNVRVPGGVENHRYEIDWQDTAAGDANYERTFIYFDGNGTSDISIDSVALRITGSRYGKHSIFVENCNKVTLTNLYLEGPVDQIHVRIRNCKEIYIDRVEIAGREDPASPGSYRLGGGIAVDNGSKGDAPAWVDSWVTIQNVYVHDFNTTDGGSYLAYNANPNFDAISIRSPGDGILFNVFVENWKGLIEAGGKAFIDAGLDFGHDRVASGYEGKTFRIERAIFDGVDFNKLAGRYNVPSANNRVFLANNIYKNTSWLDYSCSFEAFFSFETYFYSDGASGTNVYYKHGGCWAPAEHPTAQVGRTHVNSSLVVMDDAGGVRPINALLYLNLNNAGIHSYAPATSSSELDDLFLFDDNVYLANFPIYIGPSKGWLVSDEIGFGSLLTFADWLANGAGQDAGSHNDEAYIAPASCFVDPANFDFRLTAGCPALGAGSWDDVNEGLEHSIRVSRDFYGASKYGVSPQPSAGAAGAEGAAGPAVPVLSLWGLAVVAGLFAGLGSRGALRRASAPGLRGSSSAAKGLR